MQTYSLLNYQIILVCNECGKISPCNRKKSGRKHCTKCKHRVRTSSRFEYNCVHNHICKCGGKFIPKRIYENETKAGVPA